MKGKGRLSTNWHWVRIIPLALVMGMIFFLSHQAGDTLNLPEIPHLDKLAHFLLYAILAAAALHALPSSLRLEHPRRTAAVLVLFCLAYGITDEAHQAFIGGRDASIHDLMADVLGAFLTALLWYRRQATRNSFLPGATKDRNP